MRASVTVVALVLASCGGGNDPTCHEQMAEVFQIPPTAVCGPYLAEPRAVACTWTVGACSTTAVYYDAPLTCRPISSYDLCAPQVTE